ncbi:MAG TPA: hypothetical protein VK364_10895 [Hymenobacter sp.]|nr:hypothetical protein [Hymenobacter sp.]
MRTERTILNGYIEVVNQLASIGNLQRSYDTKAREVQALNQSITISNSLFDSARAEYTKVLLTQHDALESKFNLIETKNAATERHSERVPALGGSWE